MVKLQIPQYRFHYYVQENKNENSQPNGEYNINTNNRGSLSEVHPHAEVRAINYRVDKSNELQADVNGNTNSTPYQISLNNPIYSTQDNDSKELMMSPKTTPIVVEPIGTQEQILSKSIEGDSVNEQKQTESIDKVTQLMEQINSNQTEDRNDDLKYEQATDQVIVQDEDLANTPTEYTIPFKKPNFISAEDFKYISNEAVKQSMVNKVLHNLNEDHEQSNPQLNFKSELSDKPLKIVNADSMETERKESYQPSHGHSSFKSQQLSNKPLRLFGYNPSVFGSLYDMQLDYNRPSQIQQPPNTFKQGYFAGLKAQSDNNKQQVQPQLQKQTHAYENSGMYISQPQTQTQTQSTSAQQEAQAQSYDSSGIYFSHPISTLQTGDYKGNKKNIVPTPTQQLYYYDPSSMAMLPVYTNVIQNTYPIAETKPHPTPQADSNKNGFNLLQILSGGTFYKGPEQSEIIQQTTVKDSIVSQESTKLQKLKPSETTHDKVKPPQTVMFYMNPSNSQVDSKPFTSPTQLTFGQQPQTDCNGLTHKAPGHKIEKPLQPIPLCADCKPALALLGLPSSRSTVIQQKKSILSPQVLPLWNGQNVSKRNFLVLPNPISK